MKAVAGALVGGVLVAAALPFVAPWAPDRPALPGVVAGNLIWVALVPLFLACRERGPGGAFLLGWLAGAVAFALSVGWVHEALTEFGGLSFAAGAGVTALLAVYLGAYWGAAMAAASLVERSLRWPRWGVLPLVWVAAEQARSVGVLGFSWSTPGYALAEVPLLVQGASLGGVHLLTFIVVLVNAASSEALARRAAPGLAVAAGSVALLAGWGAVRLSVLEHAEPGVKVALVQGNVDQRRKNDPARFALTVLASHVPPSARAAAAGAELVVWPESVYPRVLSHGALDLRQEPALRPLAGMGAHYVLTGDIDGPQGLTNSALLVGPDLEVLGRHDKVRLVPFGEYVPAASVLPVRQIVPARGAFAPGERPRPLAHPGGGALGVLICFDAAFPEVARALTAGGATLLVASSNDAWYGRTAAPHQLLGITAVRAVETGRWLVRAANTGVSAVVDPAGRVRARTTLGLSAGGEKVPPVVLEGRAAHRSERTPFVAGGDLFGWACLGFALGIVAFSLVKSRRP